MANMKSVGGILSQIIDRLESDLTEGLTVWRRFLWAPTEIAAPCLDE